eukprot:7019385-Karenia_brevis.AAC.1
MFDGPDAVEENNDDVPEPQSDVENQSLSSADDDETTELPKTAMAGWITRRVVDGTKCSRMEGLFARNKSSGKCYAL